MKRRHFASALGATAAGLGLGTALTSFQRTRAQDGRAPMRVVFYYDRPSFTRNLVFPRAVGGAAWPGANGPAGSTDLPGTRLGEWEFAPSMAPLRGLEERALNIVGLDMPTFRMMSEPNVFGEYDAADGGGHGDIRTQAMTAALRKGPDTPASHSIDQLIADRLYALENPTPLRSIGVEMSSVHVEGSPLHRPDGSPVALMTDPLEVYETLFPAELHISDEARARIGARRTSVANLVEGLGSATVRRLPRLQRVRAEEHMALHREIQLQLEERRRVDADHLPDDTILDGWRDGALASDWYRTNHERYASLSTLMPDMVAAALHANITRVAVVGHGWPSYDSWGFTPGRGAGDGLPRVDGSFGTRDDHEFHHDAYLVYGEEGPDAFHNRRETVDACNRFQQQSMLRLRRLIDQLASKTDVDGRTVLDNTLIVVCSEMASPGHDGTFFSSTLLGDAQGYFSTGRTVLCERRRRNERAEVIPGTQDIVSPAEWFHTSPDSHVGPSHAELFVSIAQAMGVEIDTFGEAGLCRGALPGLRG